MDEDANNICWEMTSQSYSALIKVLKLNNEDEISKQFNKFIKTLLF